MKMSTRQIAVAGVMSAISIFLGITHLGFIPFFGVSITIMHIPVILGAVLEGPWVGTLIGALFGIFSLLQAFLAPTGPGDLFFRDPFVSILPRLFIGVVAWAAYRAVKPLFIKNDTNGRMQRIVAWEAFKALKPFHEVAALGVAGAAGTLTNTVLVLGILVLRQYIPAPVALAVAGANAPLELAAAVIITVAVIAAWKRLEYGRGGADL